MANRRTRLALGVGIAIVIVAAAYVAARAAILRSLRDSTMIPLPGDAGTVTFVRQRHEIVSFMGAAYDRTVVHRRAGQPTHSWELAVDAGYDMRVNSYWISDDQKSFVRLDDLGDEYLIDLQSNVLYLVFPVKGVPYAGPMDDDDPMCGWSEAFYGDRSMVSAFVGGNEAVPVTTIVSDPKGRYMGAFWAGRFTSAKDAPEKPIRKLFAHR
jgi:hypothetical protein